MHEVAVGDFVLMRIRGAGLAAAARVAAQAVFTPGFPGGTPETVRRVDWICKGMPEFLLHPSVRCYFSRQSAFGEVKVAGLI